MSFGRIITSFVGRLRFRLAQLLDRICPRACWADLCVWGMGDKPWKDIDWDNTTGTCARDLAENGHCWCGKIGERK